MTNGSIRTWTADTLLESARSYQVAAVLAAAADLNLFSALVAQPLQAGELAAKLGCDQRALAILLDALAALGFVEKRGETYGLPPGAAAFLTPDSGQSVLAMVQHQANCLRRWAQLAKVVQTGRLAERAPSVRGEGGDLEAFIGAMHNVSAPVAEAVVRNVVPPACHHILDVGGASGTWTEAFLRVCCSARATLFDVPEVIPMARSRLASVGLSSRVTLVAGDFLADPLPGGADLAWVSAIVHQNSRAQNRVLFGNVFQALMPGGRVVIRDILMEGNRTRPVAGALFAVNMLVATESGGTFLFEELRQDLESAGFLEAQVVRREEDMNSLVEASKPPALS